MTSLTYAVNDIRLLPFNQNVKFKFLAYNYIKYLNKKFVSFIIILFNFNRIVSLYIKKVLRVYFFLYILVI